MCIGHPVLRSRGPHRAYQPPPIHCRRRCLGLQEEERLELFNRHTRSGAATPFDAPLPYTGISGAEVRAALLEPVGSFD